MHQVLETVHGHLAEHGGEDGFKFLTDKGTFLFRFVDYFQLCLEYQEFGEDRCGFSQRQRCFTVEVAFFRGKQPGVRRGRVHAPRWKRHDACRCS